MNLSSKFDNFALQNDMNMQTVLSYPKFTTIRPQGNLNAANALEFERDLISTLRDDLNTVLIVDLKEVESLDSAGLMALVSALKLAQTLQKTFRICSVSPAIRIIFEVTQLDRVFEIIDSVALTNV
jgi:anti-sigma B factor antagonist